MHTRRQVISLSTLTALLGAPAQPVAHLMIEARMRPSVANSVPQCGISVVLTARCTSARGHQQKSWHRASFVRFPRERISGAHPAPPSVEAIATPGFGPAALCDGTTVSGKGEPAHGARILWGGLWIGAPGVIGGWGTELTRTLLPSAVPKSLNQ